MIDKDDCTFSLVNFEHVNADWANNNKFILVFSQVPRKKIR